MRGESWHCIMRGLCVLCVLYVVVLFPVVEVMVRYCAAALGTCMNLQALPLSCKDYPISKRLEQKGILDCCIEYRTASETLLLEKMIPFRKFVTNHCGVSETLHRHCLTESGRCVSMNAAKL
jgi:hypothetical protein